MLEVIGIAADDSLIAEWRARVGRARARLGWTMPGVAARLHVSGASLALAAPYDQLFVATEVNEWALCTALLERDPHHWPGLQDALIAAALDDADDPDSFIPPVLNEAAALARFERLAALEARPRLRALIEAATARALPHVLDEVLLTLGAGEASVDFPLEDLPAVGEVSWDALRDIPTAIVTGSNGKTTTVRVLAACARAAGWHTAYSSTDGVFVDAQTLATGDYSGPAGARMAMRSRRAQAAILETARGGILRRGLAVAHAQVAVVTNVSSDHFGEYGIYDLDGLADVKLSVAAVVPPEGLLVLNGDDALLRSKANGLPLRFMRCPALGWFSQDADLRLLLEHRAKGGSTCGVRDGKLYVSHGGKDYDLGAIREMPLTVAGSATYNIANIAGAALAAVALGIPASTVATVVARFGAGHGDNLGRMMRFDVGGFQVLLDYAHNAEGLRGLLKVAEHLRGGIGRLGMLLGHAGNRRDIEIEEVARVAAEFRPSLVVVKENDSQLRGREPGEVPRIIRAALVRAGLPDAALEARMSEVEAARLAIEWARPGDVLALPIHSLAARAAVVAILDGRVGSSAADELNPLRTPGTP